MKAARLTILKIFALAFLLVGLAGLIASATISTHYLDVLPTSPAPGEGRTVPRDIHGLIVYQTAKQDRILSTCEWTAVGIFLVGLTLSAIYLEKWGSIQVGDGEEEEHEFVENPQ